MQIIVNVDDDLLASTRRSAGDGLSIERLVVMALEAFVKAAAGQLIASGSTVPGGQRPPKQRPSAVPQGLDDEHNVGELPWSTMDSRGRITIPSVILRRLELKPRRRLLLTLQLDRSVHIKAASGERGKKADSRPEPSAQPSQPLIIDTTENLVKKGQLVSASRFQELMGWSTRQAVWKALATQRVFAISFGTERYFPAFFADTAYNRPQLEAVSKKLGAMPGGAKMQFFVSRKGSLDGKTTLEAFAAGQFEKVLRSAAAYAEV